MSQSVQRVVVLETPETFPYPWVTDKKMDDGTFYTGPLPPGAENWFTDDDTIYFEIPDKENDVYLHGIKHIHDHVEVPDDEPDEEMSENPRDESKPREDFLALKVTFLVVACLAAIGCIASVIGKFWS